MLSEEQTSQYIRLAKAGDASAKEALLEGNVSLLKSIVRRYLGKGVEFDDLFQLAGIGLLKAVDTYNPGKGSKLATYAARCIDNELLMYFRGKKKRAKDISIYEPIGTDKEGNQIHLFDVLEEETVDVVEQMEHEKDLATLRRLLPSVLSDREYQIISMRYGIGRNAHITQREAAQRLGISRSYVSRIEKKALGKLREAFFAQKPCVTVFDYVGWPETMRDHCNQLAKPDKRDILDKLSVSVVFDPGYQPFGDGHSAEKIVEKIGEFLL